MQPLHELNQSGNENVKNKMIESRGKTVEEAIQNGLTQLNLSKDDVVIEVVQEGSRGIFGFGAEDAIVQLTIKETSTAKATSPAQPVDATDYSEPGSASPVIEEAPQIEELAGLSDVDDIPAETDYTPVQLRARAILETLLEKMSIEAEVAIRSGEDLVEPDEELPLSLDIEGNDLGVLIGRRGETLRSLQFIVRQILSKEEGHWVPVVIDVESYLVRHRKSLKQLADRMAEKVVTSNNKVTLEPMSGQDRRIIHLQLRDHDGVYTQSVGENERRKVVIYPKNP